MKTHKKTTLLQNDGRKEVVFLCFFSTIINFLCAFTPALFSVPFTSIPTWNEGFSENFFFSTEEELLHLLVVHSLPCQVGAGGGGGALNVWD